MDTPLFESSKYKLIYVFRINDDVHQGCVKIGETTIRETLSAEEALALQPNADILNKYAKERIDSYTQTASILYDLLHTEAAVYKSGDKICSFRDHNVHDVLKRSGINRKVFEGVDAQGTEWYEIGLATAKNAIKAVKEGRTSLRPDEVSDGQSPIIFRPEQRDAIDRTKKHFRKGNQMLWNAKMRFGKTLSALQVVKEMQFQRTLILTHRPVVDKGWFDDFGKIFYDTEEYIYGSKNKGGSFQSLTTAAGNGKRIVYFASMQGLRGSEIVGGNFDKNNEVFHMPWDLIIIDEAHEGTQTDLGRRVMAELVKETTKVLRLSGTPFNLLDDFKEEEIYTWDYVMEQRAKAEWDKTHFGDHNPYAELPTMHIYTYDLGSLLTKFADEDVAFNFREFFRVNDSGKLIHEKDVRAFLNLLVKHDKDNGSCYPFANDTFRNIFRHTLWTVPGVQSALALERLLREYTVFKHFHVVNVAGDGDPDDEEKNREALEKVKAAIGDNPDETRTITLTCGRLTTGVTVPAWTGVLMLSGSYSTAASAYMQTIFRVQSPATINGHTKEDCYVFDFAPDRTLQVLATVPRVSTKAGKTTEKQREALKDFINFCPVIAYEGSEMRRNQMTPDIMLQQLKRAYVERVVRSGFEDGHLYSDKLFQLSGKEVEAFNNLKRIIGTTKALGNISGIEINNQGLTDEQYEEKERLETEKRKRQLTEEEEKRLAELKEAKKGRDKAISILRGISVRMPLLIYGAEINDKEEKVTLDNFTKLVDDLSWQEFMPGGVTKQIFNDFKQYYDPDIFSAAGKRIRSLARSADKMPIEERIERIADIFATLRNPDKETVLTPWRVVNMHLGDTLGGYCFFDGKYENRLPEEPRYIDRGDITDEVFAPDTRLLEINSKTGLYPLYLAYNVYRRRLKDRLSPPQTQGEHLREWDRAVAENIFVICKTPMAESITRRTLVGFRRAKVNARYFENLVSRLKDPQKQQTFLKEAVKAKTYGNHNIKQRMKFNAIVGNPPYQEEGISANKPPVYHLFYDLAFSLSDRVTLITPGRFVFKAGDTPKEWMEQMLTDKHIKVVSYFKKSTDVFPFVDVKGGVAITLRDTKQDFGAIGFFSEYAELSSIKEKVWATNPESLSTIISNRGKYRYSYKAYAEQPDEMKKTADRRIAPSAFERMPNLFTEQRPNDGYEYIQIFGNLHNARVYRWFRKDYLIPIENLYKYKVLIPKANGSGAIGEVLSTPLIGEPLIGEPLIGYTETYISVGNVDTFEEAEAILKYVKTKFARCLLGILKVTQNQTNTTWKYVPMQDFTANSDIDWGQEVADIDKQLYRKYGLSEEEREFIETMIKPM